MKDVAKIEETETTAGGKEEWEHKKKKNERNKLDNDHKLDFCSHDVLAVVSPRVVMRLTHPAIDRSVCNRSIKPAANRLSGDQPIKRAIRSTIETSCHHSPPCRTANRPAYRLSNEAINQRSCRLTIRANYRTFKQPRPSFQPIDQPPDQPIDQPRNHPSKHLSCR